MTVHLLLTALAQLLLLLLLLLLFKECCGCSTEVLRIFCLCELLLALWQNIRTSFLFFEEKKRKKYSWWLILIRKLESDYYCDSAKLSLPWLKYLIASWFHKISSYFIEVIYLAFVVDLVVVQYSESKYRMA